MNQMNGTNEKRSTLELVTIALVPVSVIVKAICALILAIYFSH
jgi:hypothetical protein